MNHAVKSAAWGGRKRKVATVAFVALLIAAASATAAWIVLSGASGSGGAKYSTSQISPSINLVPAYQAGDVTVEPGVGGDVYANVVNSSSQPVRILTLSPGTITATPACNTAGTEWAAASTAVGPGGQLFSPGTTSRVRLGMLTGPANLDPACSGSDIAISFTGTTQP